MAEVLQGLGSLYLQLGNGAKTILIAKNGVLGDQMTSGLVTGFHGMQIHKGYFDSEGNGSYLCVNYKEGKESFFEKIFRL